MQVISAETSATPDLRFGILGAARIAPMALIAPARRVAGVRVEGVAARDPARSRDFAARHGLARSFGSYAALVEDPDITAVYIALPNSLHYEWALAALESGKHVLCEKPLTSNAAEAERLAHAAAGRGTLLVEAFHNRHHPFVRRIAQVVHGGELGEIISMRAVFRTPMLRRDDIRFKYELAGGALMDLGCYMINLVRYVSGEEPEVLRAQADLLAPQVDKRMRAELALASGAVVALDVEMRALRFPAVYLQVQGERGRLTAVNPVLPQIYHHLRVESDAERRTERFARTSTYALQLAAFAQGVRGGPAIVTDAADAVKTMRILDALYEAAGLRLRGT